MPLAQSGTESEYNGHNNIGQIVTIFLLPAMVPRHRRQYLPFSSFHPERQNGASCLKHTLYKLAAANDRTDSGDNDSQPGLLSALRSRSLQLSLPRTLLATTTALHVTQIWLLTLLCRHAECFHQTSSSLILFCHLTLTLENDCKKKNVNLPPGNGASSSCSQSSPLAFSQPALAYSASSKDICSLCSWHLYIPFAKHSKYLSSTQR